MRPERLKEITIGADYSIENLPCCNKNLDIWYHFKNSPDFKFCPFCKRTLKRTIFVPENSMIGWSDKSRGIE